tara:strand:- start:3484 stop:3651 length:168 start_codon:yes stop_codon:yes gene_type:complete
MKRKKVDRDKIELCPLLGGDYIVSLNLVYSKKELDKLGIITEEDIKKYIKKKLDF